jgi:phage terminase small subunit
MAYVLLRKHEIAIALKEAQRQRAARVEITQDRVLQEVARLAFLDYRKFVNDDGSVKPIHELDDDTAAALAGLDVFEEFEGRGEDRVQIGFTKKLKVFDKKGALELLMRHMGMLNDSMKLKGDAENPLVVLLRQMQGTALKPTAADDVSD